MVQKTKVVSAHTRSKGSHFVADQNYQVASWDDSSKLCDLAGENDVCSSTSGLCNIKLSVENVSHIFSNPLWINGFVTRPPWIYHIGKYKVLTQLQKCNLY